MNCLIHYISTILKKNLPFQLKYNVINIAYRFIMASNINKPSWYVLHTRSRFENVVNGLRTGFLDAGDLPMSVLAKVSKRVMGVVAATPTPTTTKRDVVSSIILLSHTF